MVNKKNKIKINPAELGKGLKSVLSVIPDTTKVITDSIEKAAPLIEKQMDRNFEKHKDEIEIPNVIDMKKDEAKSLLESRGFIVSAILQKPEAKFAKAFPDEVVAMFPFSGAVNTGTLIKIYYMDEASITESKAKAMAESGKDILSDLTKGVSSGAKKIFKSDEDKLKQNETELRRLKKLLDEELITQEDFDAEKQEILDRNNPKKIPNLLGKLGKR
ncbi:MAG: hypothetical protein LBI13_06645 [Streptococcaceae bacterium]|jgi:ribosome-associated protein YbcJ (S4-like RNA binding protein)|nr:hypothetical protein [Streptococcaceae bacterium]